MEKHEQLNLQRELAKKYKAYLRSTKNADENYKWLAIDHFQKNWNIEDENFPKMFNLSFKQRENLFYQNSWGFIKKAVDHEPIEVKRMFMNLYKDGSSLISRFESFVNESNSRLPFLKKSLHTEKLNHQQDERTISVYLALRYPEKYYLFKDSYYQAYCTLIGEKPELAGNKLTHFNKLADDFKNEILLQDAEILKLHKEINPGYIWDDTNLIVQNIFFTMLEPKGINFIIINITWNSNDWKEPSHDKSGHKWVSGGGQPHESWNFDFENPRNTAENIFGFVQVTNPPKVSGNNNLVIFYSNDKIVGFYGKCEFLAKAVPVNDDQSYNIKAEREYCVGLKVKLNNVKEKGYLEDKDRVGQIGFNYIKKQETVIRIIEEAMQLNPDNVEILSNIKKWIQGEYILQPDSKKKDKSMNEISLNQILYGPPGTGKTYNTINEAIRIADLDYYKMHETNHAELRKRFNELLITDWKNPQKGQISFCTFHQSFSYEDFIEGIKPIISDDESDDRNESLKYTIEDGIFKRMADRARHYSSIEAQRDKQSIQLSESEYLNSQFYKLSLGDTQKAEDQAIYDYCIENNCIAIGFMSTFDLNGYDEQRIYKLAEQEKLSRFEAQAMCYFNLYLKEENYVIVSKGNLKIRAIGKVKGPYYYKEDTGITYKHFRKVDWIISGADIPVEEVYQKAFSQQSIYKLNSAWINKEYFVKPVIASSDYIAPNFVLIIDEINRGNISQIFGELITLIEKDKRSGNPEALQVTLPYSKEKFSVPANLYLIGTMNTADRSIEALDTALRRRFVFSEMPPKPHLIADVGKSKGTIDGIDLVKMLETINHRIEKLLDKDHQIGHSYLLEAKTFDELTYSFRNQIIPLLEEYFYGSLGKIGLVLGESFVNVRNGNTKDTSFAKFKAFEDDTIADLATRKIYQITDSSQWSIEGFKSIYE